ncbi:MAG: hypothetical protein ABIP65_00430 [Vicinamibacterales bacterium]
MIAARHLPAVAALLALACVPTVLHSYTSMTLEDGRSAAAMPLRLNGIDGRPGGHSVTWVQSTYGTTDFVERQYGPALTLFVGRSFDAKRLYHHPEHGIAHGDGYEGAIVVRRPERPDLPIFVLDNARDRRSVYALLYAGEFVEHPIRFQLQNAFALLVRPRELMTLFFVRGMTGRESPTAIASADALLLAAVDSFIAQPGRSLP